MSCLSNVDKLVFTNWEIGDCDGAYGENHEPLPQLELLIGLDFGFIADPTALIISLLDEENKTIYIIDSWGAKGLTNEKIAKAITDKGYSKSVIIADSAE